MTFSAIDAGAPARSWTPWRWKLPLLSLIACEAALAIGMTNALAMRSIVLPQALRIIVPPMANYAVSLLKDTSVASLISAPELMLRARDLSSEYFMPMELYLLVGAMYLVMAYPLGKGAQYLEARMGKGRVAS